MRTAVLIAALFILLAASLAGCVKQEGAPPPAPQTTEEKIESLRDVLNNQNLGKFKIIKEDEYAFGAVAYSVVVYSDYYDGIADEVDMLVGRLFANTALLSPEIRYIWIRIISLGPIQPVYEISKIDELRNNPEQWKSLSEKTYGLIQFYTYPQSPQPPQRYY